MAKPRLSIIVVFYNMAREAQRTLFTLSAAYQRRVQPDDYEVLVLDVGSSSGLTEGLLLDYGQNFRLVTVPALPSPVASINFAARIASGSAISVCIDGARMLSPGVIAFTLEALQAYKKSIVATLSFHLGPKLQNVSLLEGYCQQVEDRLLNSVDWRNDGYELFRISCLAKSSQGGVVYADQ